MALRALLKGARSPEGKPIYLYLYLYLYICIYLYMVTPHTTRTPLKNTVNTDANAAFFRIQFWICFCRLETQL